MNVDIIKSIPHLFSGFLVLQLLFPLPLLLLHDLPPLLSFPLQLLQLGLCVLLLLLHLLELLAFCIVSSALQFLQLALGLLSLHIIQLGGGSAVSACKDAQLFDDQCRYTQTQVFFKSTVQLKMIVGNVSFIGFWS